MTYLLLYLLTRIFLLKRIFYTAYCISARLLLNVDDTHTKSLDPASEKPTKIQAQFR